jgi:hypothetical protein
MFTLVDLFALALSAVMPAPLGSPPAFGQNLAGVPAMQSPSIRRDSCAAARRPPRRLFS